MFRVLSSFAGLALFSGCGPTLSEDFDSFCRVVNETNKQTNIPATDRLMLITGRAEEYSKSEESKAADNVWKKMADIPLDKRYAFLTDAANAAGKADYRCSGFEKLLATATVEANAKKVAEEKKAAEAAAAAAGGTPDAGVSPDAGTQAAEKATSKKSKKKKRKKRR